MNKHDRSLPHGAEASVEFLDGDFRLLRYGTFVRCAVTNLPIPIDDLRYWSVPLLEAYIGPEAVLKRVRERRQADAR